MARTAGARSEELHSDSLRVLLVEDFLDLAEVSADFLRSFGFDVRMTASGRDALEIAAVFDPAIVLTDLRLPDMSGLDLAKALRARLHSDRLLIAILTGVSSAELRSIEQQEAPTVDLFLPKPLNEQMVNDIRAAFNGLQRQDSGLRP